MKIPRGFQRGAGAYLFLPEMHRMGRQELMILVGASTHCARRVLGCLSSADTPEQPKLLDCPQSLEGVEGQEH